MTTHSWPLSSAGHVAASPDSALAQFYKGKTVTMIINYPAGGPSDIEGRIVAQHLPNHIPGKPNVIVKNVGGAGGIIGTNQLGEARAQRRHDRLLHPRPRRRVRRQPVAAHALRGLRGHRGRGKSAGGLCAQGHAARPQGRDRHHEGERLQGAVAQRAERKHRQPGAEPRYSRAEVPGDPGLSRPQGGRDRDPAEHRATGEFVAARLARLDPDLDGRRRHPALAARGARQGWRHAAQPVGAGASDLRGILRQRERRQEAVGLPLRGAAHQQRSAGRDVPHRHDAAEDQRRGGDDHAQPPSSRCGRIRRSSATIPT